VTSAAFGNVIVGALEYCAVPGDPGDGEAQVAGVMPLNTVGVGVGRALVEVEALPLVLVLALLLVEGASELAAAVELPWSPYTQIR
jgi:hypothetical protein